MTAISQSGPDVLLDVKVVPGASRTRVAGWIGDRIKISVAAPPEKGKANAAVVKLIAKACNIRARDVTVETGRTSPAKTIRIVDTTVDRVQTSLGIDPQAP